ncbi:hypothetical protein DSL72_005856 [Monilinia vaccinii-corymbosi]|uniref:Uncharacterized protein n=1 Tax=Monilinia vaccinii-corymbosi TaxID=61207 RepID=A0A8A3PH03_9HELO|nr:hypothetical protein DSL72_005856 [Monilinia vaccinii-corymbosi]
MASSTSSLRENILITHLSNLVENGRIRNLEDLPRPIIFLSGTTNYNQDETRWQQALTHHLFTSSSSATSPSDITKSPSPLTIIDPYNPSWNSSWSEDPSDSRFVTQVNFEIHGLEVAGIIIVGFIGSDVREGNRGAGAATLMELGVALGMKREGTTVLVCAEEGFWKEGYVRVLCERFGVECTGSLDGLMKSLREEVEARI